jgi:hypothetical protein
VWRLNDEPSIQTCMAWEMWSPLGFWRDSCVPSVRVGVQWCQFSNFVARLRRAKPNEYSWSLMFDLEQTYNVNQHVSIKIVQKRAGDCTWTNVKSYFVELASQFE